ncbi:MAG: hypothetical protein AB7L66_10325 [Gemmatimonadales bacterium]
MKAPLRDAVRAALVAPPTAAGEVALIGALDAAIGSGDIDLAPLAGAWAATRHLSFDCPAVATGAAWLADHGAPAPDGAFGPGLGAAVVGFGAVPALLGQRRNLVSGVYHLARLLDPAPEGVFAAVAAAVAGAVFAEGRRDVVPDVLESLVVNGAPASLLDALRQVPVATSAPPSVDPSAVPGQLALVLWGVHRLPAARAPEAWAGLGPSAAALGRGLLACREVSRPA